MPTGIIKAFYLKILPKSFKHIGIIYLYLRQISGITWHLKASNRYWY